MSQPPQEPSSPWGPPDPGRPQQSASATGDQPAGDQPAPATSAPPSTGSSAWGGPYGQEPAAPAAEGPPAQSLPPQSAGHGQQQYGSPGYGQGQYGQNQGHGQGQYGQPAQYGYTGTPYGQEQRASTPVSTIVLLVVSGIGVLTGVFFVAGIAPLVLSIIALVKHPRDAPLARRLTRIGWLVLAVVAVLSIIALVAIVAIVFRVDNTSGGFQTSFAAAAPTARLLVEATGLVGGCSSS